MPLRTKELFLPQIKVSLSYPMITECYSLGDKQLGWEPDHYSVYKAEVKNKWRSYKENPHIIRYVYFFR